ncbi:MAG: hypothetical protein Q9M26_07800 [Mariprofundales bacterium]|nr:hypothetical protein [Mariprofundales bacterium]
MTRAPKAAVAMRKHQWAFRARFRANGFGWKSALPIKRIKEALSEIKKVRRKEPNLAADGAVLFLERLPSALTHVDSSSGAIGGAVNRAIESLVPIIAQAPADEDLREQWLERLWQAVEDDDMPYIEALPRDWGALCATRERALQWAKRFESTLRAMWQHGDYGHFNGTYACLDCLLHAEHYQELIDLIGKAPRIGWDCRCYGVRALAALGKHAEAIRYAEESQQDRYASLASITAACEEVLLSCGMVDEAYSSYAILANTKNTYGIVNK